jgi:ABC-type polysaccharide/polyol phosphate transport system ATPase subunit
MERIIINNISKKFRIGCNRNTSFLAKTLSFFSGKEAKRTIDVLKNVSIKVNPGEIVGIIGDNGSGKSTLLRIIAGIYEPDSGEIIIRGKTVSLINLSAGLKERLTMKENIFLVSSLFGLSYSEIKKKFNSIVSFSELNSFLNTKLYQFSSGMLQRVAFSVAVHSNPDILLLDEVFEVGDENFRKKSAEKIKKLVTEGCSAILVSHDKEIIKKYCDRVVWLEEGKINKIGEPADIFDKYVKSSI